MEKTVRIAPRRELVKWKWVATVPVPAEGQTLMDPAAISASGHGCVVGSALAFEGAKGKR